jgi:outer membrane lipoprotein-sorting protein
MKKHAIAILGITVLTLSFAYPLAQKDEKATTILNKVSAKTKAYKTISTDFTYSVKSENINEEQKGKLQL